MRKKKFSGNNVAFIVGIPFLLVGVGLLIGGGAVLGNAIHYETSQTNNIVLLLTLTVMGLVFSSIAMIPLIIAVSQANQNKEIYQNGYKLSAVVSGLSPDFSVSVNGRPGMAYICDAIDDRTGKWHRFRSSEGTFKIPPAEVLSIVDVYVNGKNDEDYWVDIQSIRKCVEEYTDEQLDKFFSAANDEGFTCLTDHRLNVYQRYRI